MRRMLLANRNVLAAISQGMQDGSIHSAMHSGSPEGLVMILMDLF